MKFLFLSLLVCTLIFNADCLSILQPAKQMSLLEKLKADPEAFVSEMSEADPLIVEQVLALLNGLLETSETREGVLVDHLDQKKKALGDANARVVAAQEVVAQAVKDQQAANAAVAGADAAVTAANLDLTTKQTAQAQAQTEKDDSQKGHDNEIDGLNDDQSILRQVIELLTKFLTTSPTQSPTASPTTQSPTASPTTQSPTTSPTASPTTQSPTTSPTASPTTSPTTQSPTTSPTASPTASPTTQSPTTSPTASPTTQSPTTLSPDLSDPSGCKFNSGCDKCATVAYDKGLTELSPGACPNCNCGSKWGRQCGCIHCSNSPANKCIPIDIATQSPTTTPTTQSPTSPTTQSSGAIDLQQVTCSGQNTIQLDNNINYDKAFEINFKFTSSTEHYGGIVGMREGDRLIVFVVRKMSTGLIFGASIKDGTHALTTFSGGTPTYKVVPIVVGQEYSVKVIHDEDGNLNIFFDGAAYASGNMNLGAFNQLHICKGIGGGAGNFQGTVTNLHLGNVYEEYYVVKGSSSIQCSEPSNDCSTRLMDSRETMGIRCCSDSLISHFTKKIEGCWGSSYSDKDGTSQISLTCGSETPSPRDNWCSRGTWAEANARCASVGGRLCTKLEVENGCVVGTGCGLDCYLIWTSSRLIDY